jgi:diguanylate cyclase (GGDEF)-like protein/PAS domain S-box-containing protein
VDSRRENFRYSKIRLAAIVWPFVAVILAQAAIASVSIYTLSAVRSYAAGESVWSKGYKQAVHALEHFVATGDVDEFREFERSIGIPLGDRRARLALEASPADVDRARQGFLTGRNHPSDIPGMIWLFRNFRHVSYLSDAIERWSEADPKIVELVEIAHLIKRERARLGQVDAIHIDTWTARIDKLDQEITPLTLRFSEALGRGSRAITYILFSVNVVSAALLILLAVWRTRSLLNQQSVFEAALVAERKRARVTLSSIGQAVLTTDQDGRVDYLNPVAEKLLGVSSREAMRARLKDLFSFVDEGPNLSVEDMLGRLFLGAQIPSTPAPRMLMRRDGGTLPVSFVAAPLMVEGSVSGTVIVLHDMTREHEYIDRLSHQASHDALTDLTNRRAFEERLGQMIAALASQPNAHAVMFIDLDQFKIVNDTCGHAAGDELLKQVARTIRDALGADDLLARLGGDEFGVILPQIEIAEAAATAERLRAAVAAMKFFWKGRSFAISASIGLVEVSDALVTLEETLQSADVACYLAKEKGRDRVQIHIAGDGELQNRIGEMAWVQRIRRAVEKDRFVLFAQPIVPLAGPADGLHLEVLLRLDDGAGGFVSPGTFIPSAERYGLMPLIDRWVVSHAFAAISAHLADSASPPLFKCAVNLSGQSIGDPTFTDFVRAQFRRHAVPPGIVCFEITETSAIANLSTARVFVERMKALGSSFSLDDFGAGMSSFGYLKNLDVDYLKIDGGFVKDIVDDRIDRAMVEMIHHIGRVTGKRTIAEFVESEAILAALQEIGVDYAQGYAIARPRPFADFRCADACPDVASLSELPKRPNMRKLRLAG